MHISTFVSKTIFSVKCPSSLKMQALKNLVIPFGNFFTQMQMHFLTVLKFSTHKWSLNVYVTLSHLRIPEDAFAMYTLNTGRYLNVHRCTLKCVPGKWLHF